MSAKELQEEEIEVLRSIYDGDDNFKEINDTTFQYKIGEDGNHQAFLLEIRWGDTYPDEAPTINLDLFYNKHLVKEVKTEIIEKLKEQVEMFLGSAMTYSLFEYAKENSSDLTVNQPEAPVQTESVQEKEASGDNANTQTAKTKEKKVQLTKAQKRKMFDRMGNDGERPRGWDWVDIVRHLSQTGKSAEEPS